MVLWPFRRTEDRSRQEPALGSRAFSGRTNAAPESLATATVQAAITVICRAFEGRDRHRRRRDRKTVVDRTDHPGDAWNMANHAVV